MKLLSNVVISTTLTLAAFSINKNHTIAASLEDIPLPPEDIPSWVKPDLIAFAGYDYRLTEGREGEYTTLVKGSESLFDETQSGISELIGDWSWISGVGWSTTANSTETQSITHHWKNVRVPTNQKTFDQRIELMGGQTAINVGVTTDNEDEYLDFDWHVETDEDTGKDIIVIKSIINPQPNDVFVKIFFKEQNVNPDNLLNSLDLSPSQTSIIIEQGWILDQCEPVPEPTSTLSLLSLGILGAGATLKRKLKPSNSIDKEITKIG